MNFNLTPYLRHTEAQMDTKQLVISKYLFQKGRDTLRRGDTISPGLAVSLFQDAAEMFLRAVAKLVDADVKEKESFEGFWEKMGEH